MKTLKILTAALVLAFTSSAFAAEEVKNEKLQMNYTIQTYIDAIAHGKIKDLSEILDKDVKHTVTTGEKVINYTRADILNSMQPRKNIEQNCSTTYQVLEINSPQAIIKVLMKYDTFTKITLVNIANTKNGWKITNITDSYM
ncbi:nuclear transport factor 2 family protein [Pedobacter sp. P351]|uniref:nuclear transport factor 2 family protein n=1 Tax=Pedobacter superstes TaxID=3133441 RepID=UPI003098560A